MPAAQSRSKSTRRKSNAASRSPYVKFWGVRGSIPTPGPTTLHYGGNTSCIEIRADDEIIILDGGTGLRPLGRSLVKEFGRKPMSLNMLLTHTHWDHIQGIPFFLPFYGPQNHLRIQGYEGAKHGLHKVLNSQMENPYFPIGFRAVPANVKIEELKQKHFKIGPIRVEACLANHPGICVGYRLFTSGGSVAFFPDNEPHYGHSHAQRTHGIGDNKTPQLARNEDQKIFEFLQNCDVLIMDAQYERDEYESHRGWGHACMDDVVNLAMEAKVKHLFLFHHDPEHDDAHITRMVRRGRKIVASKRGTLKVDAAREGLVVPLKA